MQVSIPEELVEEFGGIEEILKHGVDKRYRDLNCRVEEGVLVSESMLHRETTYSKERCQCGYCITIEPNGFRWWNVEFECRPEELRVEEGDQYEYDEEISDGYFIEKVRPEMITETFLVEVRNEEMYVVKKETRKHIVQRMTNEEEMRLALQKALDKVQHVAILAGYLVNVGVVERMSEEERRLRHIPEW